LKDNSRRDYTLNSTTLGPTNGVQFKAEAPVTISAWVLDVENYRACPALNNGEVGAILDLRPLFEQFQSETGTA